MRVKYRLTPKYTKVFKSSTILLKLAYILVFQRDFNGVFCINFGNILFT